ncbi:ABC transporter permease [Thioalkalivibrio denitrificans]|uniref:Transport permease protein n=1 Tax=Thioalkalivibrio denitrificans TaxID=108003 RepID=A0A1V3NS69_9GAMM|nr:ABC transporter permease [Thioalkalivibrio denitrificans]OOG27662.1 ABC transporter permease [Thioalkalivibrio denitrificans]
MSLRRNLIALQTIVIKEVLRFSRIWLQTVFPPMITTALYFIIFGGLIGARIGEMDGLRYMDFIVPGLIMMAIITNSYANVVSSFYGSKFQHHIEEMMVAPIPNYLIILGFVAGGVARGLTVGVAVTIVSLFFSPFSMHSLGVTLSVVVLTSTLFALAGLINGIFAKSFDDISIIPTFVLTPLTYLGGVFYSISLLPEFWQGMSHLNPILYMVNAFRYGLLGVTDINLWLSYAIILGFIAALFTFSLYLLNKGHGIRN